MLRDLRIDDEGGGRPNVFFFDIQNDQRTLVDSAIRTIGRTTPGTFTSIVPMRLAEVKGRPVRDILARGDTLRQDTTSATTPARGRRGAPGGEGSLWAFRREYRSTYRAQLSETETIAAGTWISHVNYHPGDTVPVSVEQLVSPFGSVRPQYAVEVGAAMTVAAPLPPGVICIFVVFSQSSR